MNELQDFSALDSHSDLEKYFTVFEGSSQEDVAYAKVFWNSLSLQPPVESSLVSVDIRQRLKVAKSPQPPNRGPSLSSNPKNDEVLQRAYQRQMEDERKRYMEMAKKRDEIMMLLKKQREERIKKEMISLQHKPRRLDLTERYQRQFELLNFRFLWGCSSREMMLGIAYNKRGRVRNRGLH
ncbi:cilia- and flagella-associated protein HOATZ isoform X1 [Pygocentrus nattereri]|uniref:cilia- and flagella-associated protein HOATZ isoform X1 n=1 Tax=Pygocentrus nattereri TaxID=42514 RepID=UPI0018917210|nr:cilia- and flagella-associated protein HOATZ isoform X1 [Pygocentrus nattereri]